MMAVLLLTTVIVSFLAALIMYKYMASCSRHKVQAIYVAERIIEEQRRQPFANLVSFNYGAVSIDNNGTFNTTADDYMGSALVTVTNLDAYRRRVKVEVDWKERSPIGGPAVNRKEFCSTDIADEPQLN